MTAVKICGITGIEDAHLAIDCGADMLGFNFYPRSPRFIAPDVCLRLVSGLGERRKKATMVGVFVNMPPQKVREVLEYCRLDLAQLSGDEPSRELDLFGELAFKAVRPRSAEELGHVLATYPIRSKAPQFLIDASKAGFYGGTGEQANWQVAALLSSQKHILLAGGLDPDNVAQAIMQVNPWGVDVASGVERSPGKKDPDRLQAFIQAVKG